MKSIKSILIAAMLLLAGAASAQLSVNINIGTPPPWGPSGYNDVRFYYLPDVEAYYDVNPSMVIYYGGGVWVHNRYLPGRYRNYDLYSGYKVVISDYHGDSPYSHFKKHKTKYAKGYHHGTQKSYGEKPGRGNSDKKANSNHPSNGKVNHDNGRSKENANERGSSKGNGNNM